MVFVIKAIAGYSSKAHNSQILVCGIFKLLTKFIIGNNSLSFFLSSFKSIPSLIIKKEVLCPVFMFQENGFPFSFIWDQISPFFSVFFPPYSSLNVFNINNFISRIPTEIITFLCIFSFETPL